MSKFIFLLFFLFLRPSGAAILDKIVAIYDDRPILLSQLKRIQESIPARQNISPQIFQKNKYSLKQLAEIKIHSQLIQSKLNSMGYTVTDSQVESQIKLTEKRLHLNRKALLDFLKNNNFSFDEYFELIRESIEYNLFISKIIQPLISITDQDIKNSYYKKYSHNKSLTFHYNLVDFSFPAKKSNKKLLKNFKSTLKSFQKTGVLPQAYSSVTSHDLGSLKEESLMGKIRKALSNIQEGQFSDPILLGSEYHSFYVKVKDLAESQDYLEKKNLIYSELFTSAIKTISQSWFKSELRKHYVKLLF